ncbi:MAG TPA: YfhO family protein [Pyrinomonadaceae bacterium]|nr:YfhO family protein [Pyrinomonadaceae bacterium]
MNFHVLRGRRDDALAVGVFVIFFIIFFSHILFSGHYILRGDALFYSYPLRTVAWDMLLSGTLPLWTPTILSGYPLLSMAQLGLAYPLTWGYLFLPGHLAEQIYILAPFLLAPIFTYAYLREVGRSQLGSLLGALTFGYGGMMASPLSSNGLFSNAAIWLPLVLIAIERARHGAFLRCLAAATLFYSLSVLTGVGQAFLYLGLLAGAYAVFLVLVADSVPGTFWMRLSSLRQWRPMLVVTGAGLLTLGVTAFQLMESARAVRRSIRSVLSYELFTQGSIAPSDLWKSFTTPVFYSIDMSAYVPPLAALLGVAAFYLHLRGNRERDPRVFFWFGVAVVACVLMMGAFTPVYRLVYHIPLLNLFRVPSRHAFEWTFAVGVLAAYGWDAITPAIRQRREAIPRSQISTLYAVLALLVLAILIGSIWWNLGQTLQRISSGAIRSTDIYRLLKLAFVLVTTAAVWRAGLILAKRPRYTALLSCILLLCFVEPSLLISRWWGRTGNPAEYFSTPSDATRYLKEFAPEHHRIYTRTSLMAEEFNPTPRLDGANVSALYGLHNVAGYEPLILDRYSRALGGLWIDAVHTADRGEPDSSLFTTNSQVLDILNTAFVVAYPNLGYLVGAPPTPYSDAWQPVYEKNETLILRNTRVLPRAWLVTEAEAVKGEEALARIRGESTKTFDPRRTVLLETHPDELRNLPGGEPSPNSTALIVSYTPNRLVIETSASTSSVLVVSEIFYPGWEATVDGQRTQMQVANYLLRAVILPPGQHRVDMRYTAPAARNGAIISLSTLLLLGCMFIYRGRRSSRQVTSQTSKLSTPP